MVRVRFVNTPEGKDVVAVAHDGDNLMRVGIGWGGWVGGWIGFLSLSPFLWLVRV